MLVMLGRQFRFTRDGEDVVVNVNIYILFLESGELKARGDSICLFVLMNVHPIVLVGNVVLMYREMQLTLVLKRGLRCPPVVEPGHSQYCYRWYER